MQARFDRRVCREEGLALDRKYTKKISREEGRKSCVAETDEEARVFRGKSFLLVCVS